MRDAIATWVNRLPGRLVAICLLATVHAAGAAHGLIYRISAAGAPSSYLVGTMHSEDPRVTGLMTEFGPLIGQVDAVAIELIPDAVTLLVVGAATLLPLDQRLRDLIGAERFAALTRAAAARGLQPALLDRLRPWAAAVTLGMPDAETGRFLDMEIYLEALRRERRVVGLETAAEQLAVFADMPQALQIVMLDDVVKNADRMPTQMEQLTSAFLRGDPDALERAAREQVGAMSPEIADWMQEQLLDQRNQRMLQRLSALLPEQRLLIAVGALHLGGDSGLVAGLRRRGYRVTRWPD